MPPCGSILLLEGLDLLRMRYADNDRTSDNWVVVVIHIGSWYVVLPVLNISLR